MYTNEIIYPTWREDPTPAIEQIRTYLIMDYSYPKDIERCKKDQQDAIREMWERAEKLNISDEDREKLRKALELAMAMTPACWDDIATLNPALFRRLSGGILYLRPLKREYVREFIKYHFGELHTLLAEEVYEYLYKISNGIQGKYLSTLPYS